ncbi:MAG: xanthine dehydrogenase family protein molybdopterin-binding subunit [Thermoplasmata archaeon]
MTFAVRPDADAKLRGQVTFATDLDVPGMLWGALVPAPVARGRIRSIDLGPARAIEGVVAIGAADLARLLPSATADAERPVFPSERVQYHSQPLAAVAAPTRVLAQRAARAVRVDVEPMPPLEEIEGFDPNHAGADHPEVIAHVLARHGDLGEAFGSADFVLSETYRTAGVCQVALEPHACVAEIRGDIWHVTTSTQTPFGAREDLAAMFGVPEERIVVEGTWVGGGFGGKGAPLVEPYALLLARASGRPVRLALSYREEFQLGRTSLPSVVRIESAVKGGRITGRRVHWRLDAGSSLPGRDFTTGYAIGFIAGPYRIPAIEMEGYAFRTNKPPLGPHRAPMAPQCVFALESHMDHLAARLGVDPVAFRRKHIWKEGDSTHLGQKVGPFGLDRCLEEAGALAAKWKKGAAPHTGVAVGVGFWSTVTGAGGEARLLLSSKELTIIEGEREIGSGSVLRGIVAVAEAVLGISRDRVRVDYHDTASAPFDSGVFGSRTVAALGQAVEKAARALADELARRLSAPAKSLRIAEENGELVAVSGAHRRSIRALLTEPELAAGGLAAEGRHYGASGEIDTGRVVEGTFYPYMDFTGAAHVAMVAVDPETGAVRVTRYAAFQDAGKVIDLPTAQGSIEGAVAMGLGTALTEETVWAADGQLANAGLLDYRVPTLGEIPPIEVHFVEGFWGAGPFGAKGLGEPPIIPVPATVGNAIFAASGAVMTELPMTPERVARALKLL